MEDKQLITNSRSSSIYSKSTLDATTMKISDTSNERSSNEHLSNEHSSNERSSNGDSSIDSIGYQLNQYKTDQKNIKLKQFIQLFDWFWLQNIDINVNNQYKIIYQWVIQLFNSIQEFDNFEQICLYLVQRQQQEIIKQQPQIFVSYNSFCDHQFFGADGIDKDYIKQFVSFIGNDNYWKQRLELYCQSQQIIRFNSRSISGDQCCDYENDYCVYQNLFILVVDHSLQNGMCSIKCPCCGYVIKKQINELNELLQNRQYQLVMTDNKHERLCPNRDFQFINIGVIDKNGLQNYVQFGVGNPFYLSLQCLLDMLMPHYNIGDQIKSMRGGTKEQTQNNQKQTDSKAISNEMKQTINNYLQEIIQQINQSQDKCKQYLLSILSSIQELLQQTELSNLTKNELNILTKNELKNRIENIKQDIENKIIEIYSLKEYMSNFNKQFSKSIQQGENTTSNNTTSNNTSNKTSINTSITTSNGTSNITFNIINMFKRLLFIIHNPKNQQYAFYINQFKTIQNNFQKEGYKDFKILISDTNRYLFNYTCKIISSNAMLWNQYNNLCQSKTIQINGNQMNIIQFYITYDIGGLLNQIIYDFSEYFRDVNQLERYQYNQMKIKHGSISYVINDKYQKNDEDRKSIAFKNLSLDFHDSDNLAPESKIVKITINNNDSNYDEIVKNEINSFLKSIYIELHQTQQRIYKISEIYTLHMGVYVSFDITDKGQQKVKEYKYFPTKDDDQKYIQQFLNLQYKNLEIFNINTSITSKTSTSTKYTICTQLYPKIIYKLSLIQLQKIIVNNVQKTPTNLMVLQNKATINYHKYISNEFEKKFYDQFISLQNLLYKTLDLQEDEVTKVIFTQLPFIIPIITYVFVLSFINFYIEKCTNKHDYFTYSTDQQFLNERVQELINLLKELKLINDDQCFSAEIWSNKNKKNIPSTIISNLQNNVLNHTCKETLNNILRMINEILQCLEER